MYPVIFQWGPIKLYSYGLMLGIAFLAGMIWVNREAKKEGLNRDDILGLILIIIASSLLGARFTYVFLYWELFQNNLSRVLAFQDGGLVFQGGFIAALAASILFIRAKKYLFWQVADIFAPALALGYGIARVGCFLNGCCYGVETGSSFGVVFPGAGLFPRHPTQLYAFAAGLLIFAVLVWLRRYKLFHGFIFLSFLLLYGTYRFIIEFFRVEPPFWGPFSFGQVIAVAFVLVGIIFLAWKARSGSFSR